jgi:hypothetical protein
MRPEKEPERRRSDVMQSVNDGFDESRKTFLVKEILAVDENLVRVSPVDVGGGNRKPLSP